MYAFFGRIGSKRSLREIIIEYIPEHETYIEPFVGGGSVLFYKEKSKKEIINDKDKGLIDAYKYLKKASTNMNKYNFQYTLENITEFMKTHQQTIENKLLQKIYIYNTTFSSKGIGNAYKLMNGVKKINELGKYQERLKRVLVLNQDYKTIIKKYDSKGAFFYLDPPYENSEKLYTNDSIDYKELCNILKNLKGKFLLSINDSKYIRDIFNDFDMYKIKVSSGSNGNIGKKERKELLILNYELH